MTQHTPGPWVGFNDRGALAAIMPAGRPGDICLFSVPPMDADAALILAAPELLAALQSVVANIEEYERINNLAPSPGKPDCWQCVTQAKAAIAKATA